MTSTTVEAQAGSLESGDLLVLLRSKGKGEGLTIHLHSPVKAQFGEHTVYLVQELLAEKGITDVDVLINDRGALDYAIRARIAACVERLRAALSCPAERLRAALGHAAPERPRTSPESEGHRP